MGNNIFQDRHENRNWLAYGLIGLGVIFLFTQWFNINLGGALWPFFIIIPGAVFLYIATQGGREQSGLVFPGTIITGTGLILFYQNLTGHWESWAYAWTLYPVMVGLALRYHGQRTGNDSEYRTGIEMVRYGLYAFAGFFVMFELVIFGGFSNFALIFIAIGLFLLFSGRGEIRLPNMGEKAKNNGYSEKRKHDEEDIII
jgi:hypothetical protein